MKSLKVTVEIWKKLKHISTEKEMSMSEVIAMFITIYEMKK